MKKILLLSLLTLFAINSIGQLNDEKTIRQILNEQTLAWNKGDIEKFMNGYWQNDSLVFIGKSGLKYGWKTTLENYKKGYPDTAAMGKLNFQILQVNRLSTVYFFIIGKWHLARTIGNLEGHFSLLFKKIKGKWLIITDHSS
jgi:ketosteroid isomerase-like protein